VSTPYPISPEPPLIAVADAVVKAVRANHALNSALDGYLRHPQSDNVRARFLTKRRAYEVTVLLDAAALVAELPE
jgi:hypothetical protein